MKLSVCVVNYQTEQQLRNFLESFMDYRPDCLHEVIVVDNGSLDDAWKDTLQDSYGAWVKLINSNKNIGFGVAQNKAVKKAKGEYVFLCNPDLEFNDDSLNDLINHADDLSDFGVIGPKLVYEDGEVQESCRRYPKFSDLVLKRLDWLPVLKKRARKYLMRDVNLKKKTKVDWLVGAAMLMKRDKFLEIGGFDPQFFLFFEDTDLCRRLNEAGHDVWYNPDFEITHSHQRLSERGWWPFKKVFWVHLDSARKYFKKWRRKAR